MRLLRAAILALGFVPGLAFAQDAARLFQPAPSRPASTSDSAPMVRAALDAPPVPIARPAADMRSTENDTETPPCPSPVRPSPMRRRRSALPGGVNAQFDITYSPLEGFRPLTLDMYAPKPSPMPCRWCCSSMAAAGIAAIPAMRRPSPISPSALAGLAAQGYVVASVNYRLSARSPFPACPSGCESRHPLAARPCLRLWRRWHPAGGLGLSAGGHLAAMADQAVA